MQFKFSDRKQRADWSTHWLPAVWLVRGWTRTSWIPPPSPRALPPAQRQDCRTHSGGKNRTERSGNQTISETTLLQEIHTYIVFLFQKKSWIPKQWTWTHMNTLRASAVTAYWYDWLHTLGRYRCKRFITIFSVYCLIPLSQVVNSVRRTWSGRTHHHVLVWYDSKQLLIHTSGSYGPTSESCVWPRDAHRLNIHTASALFLALTKCGREKSGSLAAKRSTVFASCS